MPTEQARRPFWVYLLAFFCVVLGAGGLYGGYAFVTDSDRRVDRHGR